MRVTWPARPLANRVEEEMRRAEGLAASGARADDAIAIASKVLRFAAAVQGSLPATARRLRTRALAVAMDRRLS